MHHGTDNLIIMFVDIELKKREKKKTILFVAPASHFSFSFQRSINSFSPEVRTDLIKFHFFLEVCIIQSLTLREEATHIAYLSLYGEKSNLAFVNRKKWPCKKSLSKFWKHTYSNYCIFPPACTIFHFVHKVCWGKGGIGLRLPYACAGLT